MYRIYLFKTHPYRDRIVIRHDDIGDYREDAENFSYSADYLHMNFNSNDGVNAQITVGTGGDSVTDDGMKANYVLVTEEKSSASTQAEEPKPGDEQYEIVSRWFVLEQRKLRHGQWRLTLRRDIVADNYDNCLKSAFYIEKAMLDSGNSLIYNSEGSVMNRVKVGESLLKDKTNVAWIVGYLAKGTSDLKGPVNLNSNDNSSFVSIGTTLEKWEYGPSSYSASAPLVDDPYQDRLEMIGDRIDGVIKWVDYILMQNMFPSDSEEFFWNELLWFFDPEYKLDVSQANWKGGVSFCKAVNSALEELGGIEKLREAFRKGYGFQKSDTIKSYDGALIVDTNGKHYRCHLTQGPDKGVAYGTKIDSVSNKQAFDFLLSLVQSAEYEDGKDVYDGFPSSTDDAFVFSCTSHTYYLVFEELQGFDSYFNLSGPKLVTEDAGYDVFAIPYPLNGNMDVIVRNTEGVLVGKTFTATQTNSLAIAQSIARQAGTKLYDLQLLPYCPITSGVEYKDINAGGLYKIYKLAVTTGKLASSEGLAVSYVGKSSDSGETIDTGNLIGVVLHCPSSQFSFDIGNDTMIAEDQKTSTALNVKVSNECDTYRLVSPNYQGTFEFTLSKNGFSVSDFHVDCKYRPYRPYIHVAPDFKGLYGTDYNDARGLTCSGDFSLDVISDAWVQYQINNKNYENIFNRQIEYLDFNRGQERITQAFSIGVGAIQGATTGAMAGGMVGGPIAAAAGGVAGGVSSAIGGLVDWAMSEGRYQQQREYNSDLYQYRLGNVQALPYTLTKVSSFNPNSKVVPFLEKYSCTDDEREAFEKKIEYNSMSVGAIGYLGDYIKGERTFIKGQLIRYGGIDLDDHETEELAKEFNMGVYI